MWANIKVRDVMTRGVITVHPEMPAIKAAEIMAKNKVHGLAVVDNTGEAIGVITETDFVSALGHKKPIKELLVMNIMTAHVIAITPEATLSEAAKIMEKEKISRLFVLAPHSAAVPSMRRPVGVISISDLIKVIAKERK